ncbi:MAG: sigma-54-dependent Fis family transcriptional regulator [Candidatus Marinimicrobia bacterium]|nr:sigma-54-dependent Fis family transcriptional regulator [Candidatus Neomarinimicrobiota bacterium]
MNIQKLPKLLIVDDEQPVLNALKRSLRIKFDILLSLSGFAALEILREQEVAVILADQRMPGMTGVGFFVKASRIQPDAVRVMLTGYSDVEAIIQAVNEAAIFHYLQKPWEPEVLAMILVRAAEKYELIQENRRLNRELELSNQQLSTENKLLRTEVENSHSFSNIIGESPAMQKVFTLVEKIIPTTTTVMITGATGTGKELVAQAIHYNGPRSSKMFAPQNCAALPDTLLESILFGHVKGAFTDAVKDQKGVFKLADGGTVFLDEIADTSPAFQQRLLRVLQEGEITPVGSQHTIKVDVRIISATNRDLEREVARGNFRQDLFYRLNVFRITMPSLAQRLEDIPLLVRHFVKKYSRKMGKQITGISPDCELELMGLEYSGNIRQLENIIERTIVMAQDGDIITKDLLVLDDRLKIGGRGNYPMSEQPTMILREAVNSLERQYIITALDRNGGNLSQAARELGVTRAGLYKKIARLKI